jgi:tetratricopeptide (TPR) repeat protein
VTAGIPGAGIGGLFYLGNALLMPIHELWRWSRGKSSRASRQVVRRQFAIAAGSIAAMWAMVWMISALAAIQPAVASFAGLHRGVAGQPSLPVVFSYSALSVGAATLVLVLLSVQALRFAVSPCAVSAPRILVLAFVLALPCATEGQDIDRLQRADAALKSGDAVTAEREYRVILELNPEQSRATFRLAQLLEKRDKPQAERLYRKYIGLEPEDAWGYMALAELLARDHRYDEAVSLYDTAVRLEPNESDAVDGRERILEIQKDDRSNRFAIEPAFSFSRDSDGNNKVRAVAGGDIAVTQGARFGVSVGHTRISDAFSDNSVKDFMLTARMLSKAALQFDAGVGAVRVARETLPVARVRLRASAPENKIRIDMRLNRALLDATPLLTANRVVRTEVSMRPDVGIGSRLRLRGTGGAGWMTGGGEKNNRYIVGGGTALTLTRAIEVSANFAQVQYRQASAVGYFAPSRIQTADIGSYMEFETERAVIAFDFGGGVERFREHGATFGEWRSALRGYSLLAFRLTPGKELRFEIDGYNTQAGPVAAPTSGWKYGSLSASFRWAL